LRGGDREPSPFNPIQEIPVSRLLRTLPGLLVAFATSAFFSLAAPAGAALPGGDEPAAKEAPSKPAPTIKETLAAVAEISRELKSISAIEKRLATIEGHVAGIDAIEKRLATVEKHVGGIDASLVPVGNALKPEGLRMIADLVIDTAYERAKNILMLVTAFGAVLIGFGAVALRWAFAGRRARPETPVTSREPA
jgi:hypothetical protein